MIQKENATPANIGDAAIDCAITTCDNHFASYIDLINDRINHGNWSMVALAEVARISRRQLGRLLTGQAILPVADLHRLTDVLGIDRGRAVTVVERLGDWTLYDEPVVELLLRLIGPVAAKVAAEADFVIEPLTPIAEKAFVKWLAEVIVRAFSTASDSKGIPLMVAI